MNLDFGRTPEQVKQLSNQALFADYIEHAVKESYKDGLDNQWRRLWGRIQRKLDDGIEKKAKEIDLEQGELDFIKRAFAESKFPTEIAKYVVIVEDELEKKEKEK